ncbi:phospholipase [Virgibacillus doumboii]|uniref:phospholipase n=1 Tax=Virgibacillus doumboii TaxID=2697503 RepID=UPI0013E0C0D4|nr:phospholipase [Virgibacillus doumboii]
MPQRRNRGTRFCIFPGYKYCGPGCSGPGAPIDDLDAACKAHDDCYRRFGPSCECDQLFLQRIGPMINPHTKKGRKARLMYNYMKMQTFFTCNF